jgi:hypothetical protein
MNSRIRGRSIGSKATTARSPARAARRVIGGR